MPTSMAFPFFHAPVICFLTGYYDLLGYGNYVCLDEGVCRGGEGGKIFILGKHYPYLGI